MGKKATATDKMQSEKTSHSARRGAEDTEEKAAGARYEFNFLRIDNVLTI